MADDGTNDDLRAEREQVNRMAADLDEQEWRTPAPGRTVADQVARPSFVAMVRKAQARSTLPSRSTPKLT